MTVCILQGNVLATAGIAMQNNESNMSVMGGEKKYTVIS